MRALAWERTRAHESDHWWFRARRVLVLRMVETAARAQGWPARRLRLLDYGCGTGSLIPALARLGEAWGADVAREALEGPAAAPSAGRLIDLRGAVEAHRASFDVVTALDVLEHMDDDLEGLRALGGLLVPRGQAVVTVPAYRWLWGGEDHLSEHRRRYTPDGLSTLARRSGFRVLHSSPFNLAILPAVAAVVWWRNLWTPLETQEGNVGPVPAWLDRALYRISAAEARRVGAGGLVLPAGASIAARLEWEGESRSRGRSGPGVPASRTRPRGSSPGSGR
ncbi:MAG: class I SAM-dependent methyltransferase [Planctomycetes bacterium]|nr:class I SAM-dependent methyltransferase [Planctomycetota bacterium]